MRPIIRTNELIIRLQSEVEDTIAKAEALLSNYSHQQLEAVPPSNGWSIAQIVAHLNSYNRYYLPAIAQAIQSNPVKLITHYRSGWLGNYFANAMLPNQQNKVANKMQSPKDHRPVIKQDAICVIQEFIGSQQQLLKLLQNALQKDIGSIRIPISLTRLIKLTLGDTFRFLIAHQLRHFVQIHNTIGLMKLPTVKKQEKVA